MDWNKIKVAIENIWSGLSKRIDIDNNISVYSVGSEIIRIDIRKYK